MKCCRISTMTRYKQARFPYELVLRTGGLGGRGRLGAAAPVASAASRAGARHVLGGRRWQRRPRVGWRAAGVQAVVGLVRLDAAEALPLVSAVMTRHSCRRGVWEGHRRRGEPPACSTRTTCASHALADGSTRVLGYRTCRDSPHGAGVSCPGRRAGLATLQTGGAALRDDAEIIS